MSETLQIRVPAVRRGGRQVLDPRVLSLPLGTNVALAGLNGAGKTSLFLALVGGLLRTPRATGSDAYRISYLPQGVAVPEALPVDVFGELVCGVRFEVIEGLFPDFRVGEFRARKLSALSQGERQLMACLFVLAQPAELVLLDEPMASLDMQRRSQLQRAIRERRGLSAGAVLVLASPVPTELSSTCDYLLTARNGTITEQGLLSDFLGRYREANESTADLEEAILSAVS